LIFIGGCQDGKEESLRMKKGKLQVSLGIPFDYGTTSEVLI